jgi:hypothetical protein
LVAQLAQKDVQIFFAVNDRPRGESIRKNPSAAGQRARARENDTPRLLGCPQPDRETWVVGPQCFCSDQNRIDLRT